MESTNQLDLQKYFFLTKIFLFPLTFASNDGSLLLRGYTCDNCIFLYLLQMSSLSNNAYHDYPYSIV